MKKTERVISLLLAIILLLTGVPVGGFGMVSEARRQDTYGDAQTRLLAAGSAKALPSLTQRLLPAGAPKTGTEDSALSGSESQTIVTGSDITSTSSVSGEQNGEALPSSAKAEQAAATAGQESPAQNQEEKDAQTLEAVRREMEKNPLTGGKALPIQDVDLNGTKSLARVNYIVNRDTDGIPASISWVLTYFAPKEKTAHQAFVVANGDNLDQPVIGNRTYAPGEEAAMKAREAARNRQTDKAPLFLYDIETKEANKDGFFLTTITTPIHRDEAMVAKINAAKAAKSIDKKALKDVAKELEERVYTLNTISVFGEQKITKRIQVNGKADLTATDENTTPITHVFPQKQQQDNPQQEKEKRVLFVAPNQDKKETAYQAPTFNATDTKQKEQAQILVYDFVLSQDGFYDFKAVNQRSLAQYEKQLTEIEEKGLTGEALQNARKAATLSIQPGQFAITLASETVKAEEKTTASEATQTPTETKSSENAAPSTTEEEAEEKNTASAANATDENAERAPSRIDEKAANEAAEAAAKTAELLPLGKTLAENASLRETVEEGNITNLLQPMGAPLNPFVANRPIIIEVVDRDNKGVKIPGAVVRITRTTDPSMVEEVTTGADGKATLENCNAGKYEVVQVSAPKGYFANQNKKTFTFSAIETVKYVRIDNAKDFGNKLYYIDGTVTDENNKNVKIAGVELELRAYVNTETGKGDRVLSKDRTAYTNEQGYYVFNDLDPQYIYEVAVLKAPYEYAFIADSEPSAANGRIFTDIKFQDPHGQPIRDDQGVKYKQTLDVHLSKNTNQAIPITVYNHEKGDQQVSIIGSTFQILDERGEVIKDIGTLRTDGQGKITFSLRPGNYTIEQLTSDAKHGIPNAQTNIVVQPLPHDTTQDIYLIPNPLKDIGSVTYNMDAVINWGNVTPDPQAKVILKKNGVETILTPEQIGQIYQFRNLRKYDDNHEQIDYRIELKDTTEYYATYRIINGVVNIDVHESSTPEGPGGTVTVTGNKIWYNDSKDLSKRPTMVRVVLLADGVETRYRATVSEATNWKYSFTNLPRFDAKGEEITYTVKEVQMSAGEALPGYRMDQTILGKNVLNTKIDNSKIGGEFSLKKFSLKKTDDQGKPLEGAQFTLSGTMDNGQELKPKRSLKTDANGELIFKDIPAGTYTLRETQAPDRYEPSTETWKVEVSSDGKTILIGSGVTNPVNAGFPEPLQTDQEFVKDGEGSSDPTITNEKARNPVPFRKTIYTEDDLTDAEKAKDENQVGDISKRILNTVDKNRNEYQVELTVQGRERSSFSEGKSTDIVLVVDHSGSIKASRNEDQVRSQVRNIVAAFSKFSNVKMGYVEYAGITVDKNKNAGATDNNFSDYRWWNPYESNEKYNNDPAVTSSVELTSPGQLATNSKFNTNRFGGGTFTQRALLRAQEILDKDKSTKNKHIILITDGGPTLSFKAKGSKANGTRPDGTAWEPIYKPNPAIPDNYNDVPNSGLTYNGRASDFDWNTLRGDGTFYQFGTSKGDTNQLAYDSYTAGKDKVFDNVYATISTVRDLTDAGIKITTIGYNLTTLNNAGWFNGQEKFFFPMMASTPANYSGLGKINSSDNAVTSIYEEVSKQFKLNNAKTTTPTIQNAVVTDPMGEGVDLYLGEDGVFNEKDYVLVASDGSIYKNGKAPTEGLLKDVKLNYDATDRKFRIEGLTLGKDESVSLYYSVRLKDEDKYRNGYFTPTNKRTTLVNNNRTEDFPIPAIRDRSVMPSIKVGNQAYSASGRFRILKVDESKKKPLSGAYFTLVNKKTHAEIMIKPSDKDGKIEVNNLPEGSYILKEVEAPAGYVVSGLSWEIDVSADGKTTIKQNSNDSQSSISTRSASPDAMGDLLQMGPALGLAAVGTGAPAGGNYKISTTTTFNQADSDNKKFAIHHEAVGQTLRKDLDLFFLMVPESTQALDLFNNQIRNYSMQLAQAGYQGYINVIYAGYDEASTQYTYWRIGNTPELLTQVPIGRTTTGAWMDRALDTANDVLYRHITEDTVKVITFLSTGRNFAGEEKYYKPNLKRMIEAKNSQRVKAVSHYINLVTDPNGVGTLLNTLYDRKLNITDADRQETKGKLESALLSNMKASDFQNSIDTVYSKFTVAEETVKNESLVIPLAANIHLVTGKTSPSAKIVDAQGNLHQSVNVTATDVDGMTTLRTEPITLGSGKRLIVDYDVTLKGDYERAISYPVYATGAVQWKKGDVTSKTAGIQPAYVNDPGQTLNIEVKGLEGYPDPAKVTVTTKRSEEAETFSLKNGDVKAKTILNFDKDGNTNSAKITGEPVLNTNYLKPTVDSSNYPLVRVIYARKALNLTVRKVFNNSQPGPKESMNVTLVAKADNQTIDEATLKTLGYMGSLTQPLTQKKDASGQPVTGVYETVFQGLPLKDANGKDIKYTVEAKKPDDLVNNITLIREETIDRPEEDLIRIQETEIPVLTVINTTNEIKFKKVGETGQETDENGHPIVGPDGNPLMRETPLAGTEFELRRETPEGTTVVKGYEKITSGPNGEFSFKNLPPGDYGIYETKPVLGYELPLQAVSTFTIDANGKAKDVKSFKERSKNDGDYILGIKRTLQNNVSVETAITQVEATDHNQGNRKMLYTQRIYINRNGERLTDANFGVFSAAADNPIVNGSYTVWKIPQSSNRKPMPMDFNQPLDKKNYDLTLVKKVGSPANLAAIKLGDLPSTDFYVVEVKGELEVHDDKFTSKLTFFTSATEEHGQNKPHDFVIKPSDDGTIITTFRKGNKNETGEIMVDATTEPGTGAYLVKNYRGSTFFSVRKTKEKDGKALAGARFKLWAALGRNFAIVETEHTTQVTTGADEITDKNGIVTFDNLPVNYNFYLEETETAPGFALPDYRWLVQIRPTSFLKELHSKSRDWKKYLPQDKNENSASKEEKEEARKQAAAIAYNQMLYPYTLPDPNVTNRPAEDITADKQGFKVFIYRTDGRKPLIIRPKDATGADLNGNPVDPKNYVKDESGDVIAEQSYGKHPTIPGMWYRKGWVTYENPIKGKTGQMMPINEYGQPIHSDWQKVGWKGEKVDGVSGATIRPLIVKDWIKLARDFDTFTTYYDFPTSNLYDQYVEKFHKPEHMPLATDLTIPGTTTTIPNVVGITNSQTEFVIKKVDEKGEPLEGAEFELFKVENGVESTTGIKPTRKAKNQFIFDRLEEGIYHLRETHIPDGYKDPTTYWEITVNKQGTVTKKVEKNNNPKASAGANNAQALAQPAPKAPQAMMIGEKNSLLAPIALRLATNPLVMEGVTLSSLNANEKEQTSVNTVLSPHATLSAIRARAYAATYGIYIYADDTDYNYSYTSASAGTRLGDIDDSYFRIDPNYEKKMKEEGNAFVGWQDSTLGRVSKDTTINQNLYLHSVWKKPSNVTHKVYFCDESGEYIIWSRDVIDGHTYLQDNADFPGPYPTGGKTGYEWRGWMIKLYSPTVGYYYAPYTGEDTVTQVTYLYPNWVQKPNQVILNFNMLDENNRITSTQSVEVVSGHGIDPNQIPPSKPGSRDGYIFSGWKVYDYKQGRYKDFDFKNEKFRANKTFYGYWIPGTFTVKFEDENGQLLKKYDVSHGGYVAAPNPGTKTGFTFKGWIDAKGNAFDATQAVKASATYKATWKPIDTQKVSVTFDSNGGSPVDSQVIDQGGKAKKPDNPTKEGYTFAGWTQNGQAFDFNTAINKSIALTASWTKNPDPTMNELTITNTKKDFEGKFTLYKFHKRPDGTRAELGDTLFKFTKHDGAKLPDDTFKAEEYAKKYSNPYWAYEQYFKTDMNGQLVLDHLQPGVYDLVEQTPPGGYLANPTKYVVVVNEIGNTIIVPEEGYDPKKYPIEVKQDQNPGENPDQPQKRTETKSLDAEIKVKEYHLTPSHEAGIVRPLSDQRLSMEYTIALPEDVIAGDTFTITLDKNLNWHGLQLDKKSLGDIVNENGRVVATMENKDLVVNGKPVSQVTYKLTDYVTNRSNIEIHQIVPIHIDPDQVRTSQGLRFTNIIGNKAQESDTIYVDYNPYFGSTPMAYQLGGRNQELRDYLGGRFYENREKHEIEIYYYVFGYNNSWRGEEEYPTIYNLELKAQGPYGEASDVVFDKQHPVKVSIYKTDAFMTNGWYNTQNMPPSYGTASMDLEHLLGKKDTLYTAENGKITIPLKVDEDYPQGQYQGRYGYIVKVTAPFKDQDEVNLRTEANLVSWNYFTDGYYNYGPYENRTSYWNYLHRYKDKGTGTGEDLIEIVLTKRGLSGSPNENRETASLLAGAGFKLTNNQGYQDYDVTDATGKLTFGHLKPGDYFLEEVLTPKGYTPPYVVWDIHVEKGGTVTIANQGANSLIKGGKNTLTVWNNKTKVNEPVLEFPNIPNRIEFTKVGENDNALEGAKFELQRFDAENGKYNVVKVGESGPDGKFSWSSLLPGFYQVLETDAPKGYVKPSQAVATFEVDKNTGKIVNLKIQGRDPVGENLVRNLRPMKIELLKVDGERRPIGVDKVKFLLKAAVQKTPPDAADSLSIEKDLTNSDPCLVEIPDSWDGEYILTEDRAPAGYIKTTNRYHIRVDRTNRIVQLTKVTNEQGIEIPYLDQGLLSKKAIDLYTDKMVGQVKLQVENIQPRYPSTGGFGPSQWFALIGCAVMIGSAVWFIASDRKTRRRMLRKGGGAQ